jgi:ABC-type Mn2+/Zn2+ transport system ATPase subunit
VSVSAPSTGAPAAALRVAAVDLTVGRRVPLLRGVTLSIRAGEAWFLVGPNGSGKSTLLLTLLGLLPPLAGRVERSPEVADRSGLGFVPQETPWAAALPLTVAEFTALGLADLRLGGAERRAWVAAALATMRIEDLARRNFGVLSFGQRRRVLVARALARRPRLLVLDEPTTNLDPAAARQLAADLERARLDGVAMLHASHDLLLAREFATHVALVAAGEVLAGPAAAMLADPRLAAALGGAGGARDVE